MQTINEQIDSIIGSHDEDIVVWEPRYATGVKLIDAQHRELMNLTNQLYHACLGKDVSLEAVFRDTMKRMVDYVHFHFKTEIELLERVGFPQFHDHKKQHDTLVKDILEAVKDYEDGNKFVPNAFVRTLKEWIFGHIGIYDRIYAAFIAEQKKKGLLTDEDIEA